MPEETPKPSADSTKSAASSAKSPAKKSSLGKAIATLKVQTGRITGDAGEGLVAFSQWLQERTTAEDEAASEEVSTAALNRFGQLWGKWSDLLEPVREPLPAKLKGGLTDARLTGLMVGLLVFLIVAIASIQSKSAASQARPQDRSPQPVRSTPARPPVQPTVTSRPYQGPPKTAPAAPTPSTPAPSQAPATPAPVAAPAVPVPPAPATPAPVPPAPVPPAPAASPASDSATDEIKAEAQATQEAAPANRSEPAKPNAPAAPVVGAQSSQASSNQVSPNQASPNQARANSAKPSPSAQAASAQSSQVVPQAKDTEASKPAPEKTTTAPKAAPKTAPKSAPKAAPKALTAQERLQAEVKKQLKDITAGYDEGLISRLKVDVPRSTLALNLSDAWFDLADDEQDELVASLKRKADTFDLSRVQIRDRDGHILVRKAVIGDGMIVVQRRRF